MNRFKTLHVHFHFPSHEFRLSCFVEQNEDEKNLEEFSISLTAYVKLFVFHRAEAEVRNLGVVLYRFFSNAHQIIRASFLIDILIIERYFSVRVNV